MAATSFPKSEIKVLLLENVHASAHEIFRGEGFAIEAVPKALKEDELVKKLEGGVHLLGIRSKTQVTRRVLEASKRLLSVGCFCIGTNQVDLASAHELGIPVFNAPFSNTRSVAELVIAEVVMLARHLGDRSREVHEGKWRKIAKLKFVFEDLPGDNNRVLPTADPLVPKLQYVSHDKYVDRGMNRLRSDVERIFSFLPLERIEVDSYFQKSEFHICGTTRMGLSGQDSVVDRNMIHHQYRNLFVLGSGVFPSISPSNPTLTLSALSLRAASNSF